MCASPLTFDISVERGEPTRVPAHQLQANGRIFTALSFWWQLFYKLYVKYGFGEEPQQGKRTAQPAESRWDLYMMGKCFNFSPKICTNPVCDLIFTRRHFVAFVFYMKRLWMVLFTRGLILVRRWNCIHSKLDTFLIHKGAGKNTAAV